MKRNVQNPNPNQRPTAKGKTSLTKEQTVAQLVKKELAKQSDTKYYQTVIASVSVDFSGTVFNLLTGLVRGDASNNFDGMSIQPLHLVLRYAWNSSVANSSNLVRLIVFQWFEATAPTPAAVLAGIGAATAPLQPTLIQNKRLYKVLHDSFEGLSSPFSGGVDIITRTVYIPEKRLRRVIYQTAADVIVTGGIWMLAISDDGVADYPDLQYSAEVKFME